MSIRDQIAQEALALAPEDRAYVADVLEQSLSQGEFASPEIAREWAVEIERRIAAYDRGEVQAVDVNEAMDRIRNQFAHIR